MLHASLLYLNKVGVRSFEEGYTGYYCALFRKHFSDTLPNVSMKQQRNIERLIARCESILSGKTTFVGQEWKLSKVIYHI